MKSKKRTTSAAAALTPKQERFAQEFVRTGVAAVAYRAAYNVGVRTKPGTVWSSASTLLATPKVARRVQELTEQAAERAVISRAQMLVEMGQNRAFAQSIGDVAGAQAASRDRAKILGHFPGNATNAASRTDAAEMVQDNVAPETRSLYEIARRVAFTLELGRRRSRALPPPSQEQ